MPSQSMPSAGLKQPTPRKGTETPLLPARCFSLAKQPTPRKGTETWSIIHCRTFDIKQPTPRKGTETPDLLPVAHLHVETTHTPQGDGNYQQRRRAQQTGKQPTPRKGTETRARRRQTLRWTKQPTPRKGTETLHRTCSACAAAETTHTPQGDGKPFVFTLQKLLEKPFTSPTGDN